MQTVFNRITGMFRPDSGKQTKTVLSGKTSEDIHIPAGSRVILFKNERELGNSPPYSLVFTVPEGSTMPLTDSGQKPAQTPVKPGRTDDLPF